MHRSGEMQEAKVGESNEEGRQVGQGKVRRVMSTSEGGYASRLTWDMGTNWELQ